MNIHVFTWGDLHLLQRLIKTIPRGIHVYVLDGRFVNFMPDEPVLTRGLEEWVETQHNVSYHAPPEEYLPFGHDLDVEGWLRPGPHAKAKWANYEVLPEEEWTLQMDTDELLLRLDAREFEVFDPKKRYQPDVEFYTEREFDRPFIIPRIWVPKHWTLWIDDAGIPRELMDRDASPEELYEKYFETRILDYYDFAHGVKIKNYGHHKRPEEWVRARVRHLMEIGREGRARQVEEDLPEPVDPPRTEKGGGVNLERHGED